MKTFITAIMFAAAFHAFLAAAASCDGRAENDVFCSSCAKSSKCTKDTSGLKLEDDHTCAPGTACKMEGGVALCVDPTTVPQCACPAGTKSQCDEYSGSAVLVCQPTGGVMVTAPCASGQACYGGQCGATTTPAPGAVTSYCTADTVKQWVTASANCSVYGFCMDDKDANMAIKLSCDAGQYYDSVDANACAAAPPVPCAGCKDGLCADPTNCTKYHQCKAGKSVSVFACTDTGKTKFDYKEKKCADDATAKCDPRIVCKFDSTTTPAGGATTSPGGSTATATPTATTASGTATTAACSATTKWTRYPDTTDCKKYYQCQPTASGGYQMVHGSCPGKLVFNNKTNYCDLTANVPTCNK